MLASFGLEHRAHLLKLLERRALDPRELQVEAVQGLGQGSCHCEASKPSAVGRHHVPRRELTTGPAQHILVGRHVFVPELALGDVGHGEFPALGGLLQPLQQHGR